MTNKEAKKMIDKSNTTEEISKIAAVMGRKGGLSKSDAKKNAARENGKKGGRPKKIIE